LQLGEIMPETNKSVLDIIGWCQKLEEQIQELKTENENLKKTIEEFTSKDNWLKLILYRTPEPKQTPLEVIWEGEETAETREFYRINGDRRDVIGLVKKV